MSITLIGSSITLGLYLVMSGMQYQQYSEIVTATEVIVEQESKRLDYIHDITRMKF